MFICNFSMLCVVRGKKIFCLSTSRLAWYKTQLAKESWGGGGREALLVYKQSYGCFEMVLSPEAKQNIFMTALRWFVSRENH